MVMVWIPLLKGQHYIAGIIAHYRELLGAVWLCFIFFEYSASGYYGHYCPLPGSTQSFWLWFVLFCP